MGTSPEGAKEEASAALSLDLGYQRNVPSLAAQRYIIPMSTGTGSAKYRCAQCEMAEDQCECDKYCCLCQTVLEVRVCQDGLMYCEPCRNACDYKTSG
jgi:hypothetical protein